MKNNIMTKLRVAVIGCGRISVMHFNSINALQEAELVACCDIDEGLARRTGLKYDINYYADYKQMLDSERLDAVHVCLPHHLHTEVSIYAMEKGVNVLCEKPMSIDYESAANAVKKAEKTNAQYGVIFQCRYNDASRLIKARVNGRLGKIISARSVLTWNRDKEYYSSSDWKGTWEKEGGGVVIDQAIHSIDLVNWIVDSEVTGVSCSFANRNHPYLDVEDTAEGLITYKNGVKYAFYCMNNYGCDEPIEIRFYCENGTAIMTYNDAKITYNDGTKEEITQSEVIELCDGAKDYWGFQHVKQISQFYNACLGKEELEISGAEALKTHKLICDVYKEGKKTIKQK